MAHGAQRTEAANRLVAAVAVEVFGAAATRQRVLQSIVEVAQQTFAARAASVALLERRGRYLAFEAVSGEGADDLVGSRFPADVGIAGAALATGEPVLVRDTARDPRFGIDVAEEIGYIPDAIMVAPLLREGRALGVISVLDGASDELPLLQAFATHAALAVDLGEAARRLADGERADAGRRLLAALAELLRP